MSFNAKFITAMILMLSMLTQVFAASLSCAHHSNNNSTSGFSEMGSIESHQPSLHNTQYHDKYKMHDTSKIVEISECLADAVGLQMSSEDCHCTAFIALEFMPSVAMVTGNFEYISCGVSLYQTKPVLGFITSIYHPPLKA